MGTAVKGQPSLVQPEVKLLHLEELLDFRPDQGIIRLHEQRPRDRNKFHRRGRPLHRQRSLDPRSVRSAGRGDLQHTQSLQASSSE